MGLKGKACYDNKGTPCDTRSFASIEEQYLTYLVLLPPTQSIDSSLSV